MSPKHRPTPITKTLATAKRLVSPQRRYYAAGNRALQNGDLQTAETLIERALAKGTHPAAWTQRLGLIQERAHKYREALATYYIALSENGDRADWYYRAGVCANHLGSREEALELFEHAISKDGTHTRAADALVKSIPSTTPGWRRAELLGLAINVSPKPTTLRPAATLAYSMHDYKTTIKHLDAIRETEHSERSDTVLLARALVRLGETKRAHLLLKSLATADKDPQSRTVGPGYYADQHSEWEIAFELHKAEWQTRSTTQSQAAFGAAYALDRQYLWEESLDWYTLALQSESVDTPYWNYKYAHALERTERYAEAVRWYSRALSLGAKQQWDWYYRLGYCLWQTNSLQRAYLALRVWATRNTEWVSTQTLIPTDISPTVPERSQRLDAALQQFDASLDTTATDLTLELDSGLTGVMHTPQRELARGRRALLAGDTEQAVRHFLLYLRTIISAPTNVLVEITDVLYDQALYKEAAERLLNSREFFRPDGLNTKRLIQSDYDRRRLRYAEYCDRFPVKRQTILFESYWGTRVSDNPLSIYEHLVNDPRFAEYTFYWVYQPTTELPGTLQDDARTVLVKYGTAEYDLILATAETLVNNTSFVEYFARRDTQRYINTWHGTPLKTLGKRIKTGVLEHTNVARNFMQATLLAAPNQHTATKLIYDYGVYGLANTATRVVGSPRLDTLVTEPGVTTLSTREQLGISPADERRIVFYAPTWRGGADSRRQDVEIANLALETISSDDSVIPVFRAHHLVETELENINSRVIIAPQRLSTYDILDAAHVLVTDYSSLLFDFLVTGRQAIPFIPDIEQYRLERGLYMDPSDIVTQTATTGADLLSYISNVNFQADARYKASRNEYCAYEDGQSSKRIADYIINGSCAGGTAIPETDGRQSVVLFESMIPNGIRSSFINLCNQIDDTRYSFKLTLDVKHLEANPDRNEGLASLPSHVDVLGRTGSMLQTMEERYAIQQSSRRFGETPASLDNMVATAYEREFRRVFGVPQGGTVFIDFEGYSRFWNALLARGVPKGSGNGVILHNQMDHEKDTRFPYLAEIIRNYRDYNGVASVATAISEGNAHAAKSLSVKLKSPPVVVHNTIDADSISKSRETGRSHWEGFAEANPKLVTAARLSPEKNQALLVEAMQELRKTHNEAQLVILGDGPSMSTLRSMTRNYRLDSVVHFAGFESNPMPTIADSDAFVLTSKHEGQPMVIFEAMVLGLPVVTTPVPGCVEALQHGVGAVTEFDASAIARDIATVVDRKDASRFDHTHYNKQALDEFDKFIRIIHDQIVTT